MKKYRLIVFDWDGTLVDSIPKIIACWHASAAKVHLPEMDDSTIKTTVGLSIDVALQRLYPSIDEQTSRDFKAIFKQYFVFDCPVNSPLFNGVAPMLSSLQKNGIVLAIATGKIRAGLIRSLNEFQLSNMFTTFECASAKLSKPDPKMLLNIASRLDINPNNILMVGDSIFDIQMAHAAGVDVIAVSNGAHDIQELALYNPQSIISHISALPELIRQ